MAIRETSSVHSSKIWSQVNVPHHYSLQVIGLITFHCFKGINRPSYVLPLRRMVMMNLARRMKPMTYSTPMIGWRVCQRIVRRWQGELIPRWKPPVLQVWIERLHRIMFRVSSLFFLSEILAFMSFFLNFKKLFVYFYCFLTVYFFWVETDDKIE